MTATQINAEIYRNLGFLADSETYMQRVLTFLKKLSFEKKSGASKSEVKKITIDRSRPLPTDPFVGIASPNREDDEKARKAYMEEKYGQYL